MPDHVLVVEDDAANQRVIAAILQAFDLKVTFAGNGVEALERVADEQFDVILMDIQMPLMDGFEATKCIRALGGWCADVPIIAVTAKEMESDRSALFLAGLTDVILKPINSRDFETTVLEYLADRKT